MRVKRSFLWLIVSVVFFVGVSSTPLAHAEEEFTLKAPESADAGSPVVISVEEDVTDRDFITIVPPDTREGKYKKYK